MRRVKLQRLIVLTLLIILNVFHSQGQENVFSISGQYRVRPELRHGYKTLAADTAQTAFFIGQRARLVFDFKKDKISSKISIQDSRTWGDEEQKKDLAGLQVNELWVELGLQKGFLLKMGRQELVYDDHRLLGNLDWANLTISHDALLLKYADAKTKIKWHLGVAFNQSGEPLFGTTYTLKNYKTLGFSWIKKEFDKGHSLSGMAIINGMASTTVTSKKMKATYTFGPLYNYNNKGAKAVLGVYYQGGRTDNNLTVSAFMLNAYAEKKIKKTSIGLGVDFLSGNSDNTLNTKSKNFTTLYATNHKFYGYMDYFLNIPVDTKGRGLLNPYLKLSYVASKTTVLNFDMHQFLFANENKTGANKIGKNLGTEADIVMEYKPSAVINLQLGYSMMFATKNMEYIKGGNSSNYNGWGFLMLKVTPVLFTHEFKN